MKKIFLTGLCIVSIISPFALAHEQPTTKQELRISRITPEGKDVPATKEVVVEFNRSVVPIGRMDRTKDQIPITMQPALNCQWRWLNTSTLACRLNEEDAPHLATQYTVTIKPGIQTEDGVTLLNSYEHSFTTERPDVAYATVRGWDAPNKPILFLTTNQPVTQQSLQNSLEFVLDSDRKKSYDVMVVEKSVEDKIKKQQDANSTENEIDGLNNVSAEENLALDKDKEWYIRPKQELPQDSKITLHLKPGLVSKLGPEKGISEKDITGFRTFAEFKFLYLRCTNNAGKDVYIPAQGAENPPKENTQKAANSTSSKDEAVASWCNPLNGIALSFNAPVLPSQIYKNLSFSPQIAEGSQTVWNLERESSDIREMYSGNGSYEVWLPAMKAGQIYMIATKKIEHFAEFWRSLLGLFKPQPLTDITDAFGRKLQQPIVLKFATDHRLPNFELGYQSAVLEKAIGSEVPLYVNNLHDFSFEYRALTPNNVVTAQKVQQKVPYVEDIQFAVPLGVRQLLQGGSGAVYGRLSTNPIVQKGSESAYSLFAEVTPYQVHVKLGHFNTLVWVTDLANGLPVTGAKVTIYADALTKMGAPNPLATAMTDQLGTAVLPGTASIDPDLKLTYAWGDKETKLFVRVDKGKDMAMMPLSNDFSVGTWRMLDSSIAGQDFVVTDNAKQYGHMIAWGTTAQGIYRLGDTLQYKLYVRNQNNQMLVAPPPFHYTLQLVDPTNKVIGEIKDIQLSKFGSYSGEFVIPKEAAVGWYSFVLYANVATPHKETVASDTSDQKAAMSFTPMRVLVSDFTPSPFKVTQELNGALFKPNQTVEVNTAAKLHAGGAYTDAAVRVTALLQRKLFSTKNELAKGFVFDNNVERIETQQLYQNIAPLNDKGELQTKFTLPKQPIVYGTLSIESAVQDDRGKYIATQTQANYIGVDRLVGLKATEWVYNAQKPATIQYIVVDEKGTPVAGVPVTIQIEHKVTQAARIKDAGNAYTANYSSKWETESTCQGASNATAAMVCQFTPQTSGDYRVTAHIKDTQGVVQTTQISLWVVGKNYVLWDDSNEYYLPILPEQKNYHVGDIARYLIKNPYPGAKALITIERYGVLDRFVQTFDSSSPLIEFPIKPEYVPGFYLSVMVVSPRVAKPLEGGQVDLGKPTFKAGYVAVPITDSHKELQIIAKTDQPQYRPRDRVTLQLQVHSKVKAAHPEPIELAVAVLDESVFDLLAAGRDYFNPYKGFYHLDALDMQNYSLLMRLVGRQNFEKKGANPGGDGGIDLGARNFFKFVSYWNPSIQADAQGNATVTFEAPDNLTGWRVLAMAATPTDHLGLGETHFTVNRPTEIRPVMPNQVVEGDSFNAGFSIMNRSEQTRTLKVQIQAIGDVTAKAANPYQQEVTLAPYKRTTIWLPIAAAKLAEVANKNNGEIKFVVHAGDATDKDGMEYTLTVTKARTLETVANYATSVENRIQESVVFPDKIYPDVGGINITVAPSVIANVAGAFKYLRDYPYDCWEQKLTKAVMAARYQQLQAYLPADVKWEKSAELPKTTLAAAMNYQAPNGGMTFYVPQDQYVDPYLSAYTALAFNWLKQDGYVVPSQLESRLQDYLLNFLRRDAMPSYYTNGMAATVRAVALAALAEQGKITSDDLERYLPHLKHMDLFGKAYFLQAASRVSGADNIVKQASQAIFSHADQSSGKFIFSEVLDESYQRILTSSLRTNCAILSTLTHLKSLNENPSLKDVPFKLMSTITQTRKSQDHWENTQENMFCMQALVDYSRAYEKTVPKMTLGVRVDNQLLGETQFNDLRDPAKTFVRAMQKEDSNRSRSIEITHQGSGRFYYYTQLQFAQLEQNETVNAGIEIHREYSVQREGKWILLKAPLKVQQGELVRVDLYLSLPAARNFVVVNDPVPGGLEPVNRDLATTSIVDATATQGKFTAAEGSIWFKLHDWLEYNVSRWSFYHQELRHDAVRYYSDYLPAGNYHLSYMAQAIVSGDFAAMPVKAEEMYNPDVFGKEITSYLVVQ